MPLFRSPAISRRSFASLVSTLGFTVAALPLIPKSAISATRLSYYTWAGYELPQLHQMFIDKYGADAVITFFGDEEEALAKIRAGYSPSLAHPCSASIGRWRDAGVLRPFDVGRLKNWPDLLPELTNIAGANDDKGVFWIPFDWGSNSIVYRTDKVDPAYARENSWKLLWDERYAGKIGMWGSVDGAIAMAAAILGIKDTANPTDVQFEEIKRLLTEQKKLVRFYWDSETVAEDGLASGEIVASYLWSASAARLKANGVPVDYMLHPKEGVVSFACGLVMLDKGEGDDQAKYDFIDAMLDPKSGKYMIEEYGYGHSNRRSYELVTEEKLRSQGLSREIGAYVASTSFFQAWAPELRNKYISMYNSIKSQG